MKRVLGAIVVVGLLSAAAPAGACFDGFQARMHESSLLMTGSGEWSIGEARTLARWDARIQALGASARTHAEFSTLEVCDGGATLGDASCVSHVIPDFYDLDVDGVMSRTFDTIAKTRGIDERRAQRARAAQGVLYAVQVGSFRDPQRAQALAETLNLDPPWEAQTFYTAGGFPAIHDMAHVVRADVGEQRFHRVVVGVFTDGEEARAYQREIGATGRPASIIVEHLR